MILDSGYLVICALVNKAEAGEMPKEMLARKNIMPYGERTIGMRRFYTAKSANQAIDMLVRVAHDRTIQSGMFAIIGKEQFRIELVQHVVDNGIKMTDLTLARLEERYDVFTRQITTD